MTDHTPGLDETLLFGAAYYPEYFPAERMPVDLDLMSKADVTVIRVGESVWSTWEPRDGEFDTEWLRPVLDEAHRRGIRAIIGTPTYAVPPWLQKAHPDIAGQNATDMRVPWGGRQEVDFTNPVFLRYAERMIRRVVEAYSDHPAVIGYQIDNEPGLHLLHNPAVFRRFIDELRAQYGSVYALNEAWGLVYWSHRLADFDELWTPDGNSVPQYDLAWRRFQARLTTEFLEWQADIVREYTRDDQFLTTCLAYSRPALDDVAAVRNLDVTAANLYYGMQDHLSIELDLPRFAPWTTTGVAGLYGAADRAFGTSQERFLVTETNAQAIGASDQNYPPYPGQLRQAAFALVSRGARMIEYWHWNTIPYGTETYWGGVLPHSGQPGRVYAEVSELGAELKQFSSHAMGFRPDHDVTLLYSNPSRWAFDFFPPLPGAQSPEHGGAYSLIFSAFHRGVVEGGAQASVLHDRQAAIMPVERLVADHPVLVVPALYVADRELLRKLRDYASAGGHLVLGIRSAYADTEARARVDRAPSGFSDDAGVWYEEFSNLAEPLRIRTSDTFIVREGSRATQWADGLIVDGAEVLATYDHPELSRFAAITTKGVGDGRITYVGTVPNPSLAADIVRWLVPSPVAADWKERLDAPITVMSGTTGSAERVWFVHNWSGRDVELTIPEALVDALDGGRVGVGQVVALAPWSVRVWIAASS